MLEASHDASRPCWVLLIEAGREQQVFPAQRQDLPQAERHVFKVNRARPCVAPTCASLADRIREVCSWLLTPDRKRVVSVGTGTPTPTRVWVSGRGKAADVVVRQSEYALAWCEGLAPGLEVGAVSAALDLQFP